MLVLLRFLKKVFQIILFFLLFYFLHGCLSENYSSSNKIYESEHIYLDDISITPSVKLSKVIDSVTFIMLEDYVDAESYRIKKISFSKDFIFVLYENSSDLFIYNRNGRFLNSFNEIHSNYFYSTIRSFSLDNSENRIYILGEDGRVVVCNFSNNAEINFIKAINLQTNRVVELLKLNKEDFFAMTHIYNDFDFSVSNSLDGALKKNIVYSEKVFPDDGRHVVLRNSILSDGDLFLFQKFNNDTIYAITENRLVPYKVFTFTNETVVSTTASNINSKGMGKRNQRLSFFFYNKGAFYLKYIENNEEKYLLRKSDSTFLKFLKDGLKNDIYGSVKFNCIGVDPFTNTFVFSIPKSTLNRFRSLDDSILNCRSVEVIDSFVSNSSDNVVLVLLKF